MSRIMLNIGQNVPGSTLPHAVIREAVARRLCLLSSHVVYNPREDTSVFTCGVNDIQQAIGAVYLLARECQQDCIVIRFEDGSGMLVGPSADRWGQFDPALFKGLS